MIFWVLYLSINGANFKVKHPYSFAYKNTCEIIGNKMVKEFHYKKYKCVKY